MSEVLPKINKFNIRVYGIFVKDQKVLMVRENMNGHEFTKFPGGGLELGEGIIDGLRREIMEELELEIDILEHFYTSDFFQRSLFYPSEQLISVYYLINILNFPASQSFINTRLQPGNHLLDFFWMDLNRLQPDDVTFPIDKVVVTKIKARN
jgi:ADP-ribose pyrophosphatase YjhB (NUDIX family)